MEPTLVPVAIFAAGCFTGAWLFYRGRSGTSPLPTIMPKPKQDTPKENKLVLPKVLP